MTRIISRLITLVLAASPACAAPASDSVHSVRVDGRVRSYRLHVPAELEPTKAHPLVVAFHGGAGNGAIMERFSGLSAKADEAGFVVVYPDGTGRTSRVLTWNAGSCCGYAQRQAVDDVAFVRALLDDVASTVKVDPRRVFATGISNGGMMAFRAAVELPDRFAAIAPVAGTPGVDVSGLKRAIPLIEFHGTDDEHIRYHGGSGPRSVTHTDFMSVDDAISAWSWLAQCPEKPRREDLRDVADDGTHVVRTTYAPCAEGAEVVLYTIEGGGHSWPGRPGRPRLLGRTTQDISANDLMWEFFARHPLR